MTIDKVHKIIKDLCGKQSITFIDDPLIDSYLHQMQLELFNDIFKNYGNGTYTKDALDGFKRFKDFVNSDSVGGKVDLPTDYMHLCGGSYTITYNNNLKRSFNHDITFPNEDEFNDALNCQVRVVGVTYPLGQKFGTYIQLYPKVPQMGRIYYFCTPEMPKMAYTVLGRVQTYDPLNSKQLAWSDPYIYKLILKVLSYVGVTFSEKDLIEFSNQKQFLADGNGK